MAIRVLGIDPGSRLTGYGVVERSGTRLSALSHGVIKLGSGPFEGRLLTLFQALSRIIEEHQPDAMAVEGIFFSKHANAAIKLGQARGVVLLAASLNDLSVHEFAPRAVKQAVTSSGRAEKAQVQRMIRMLLKLDDLPPSDAADALAIAVCCAQGINPTARVASR